MPSLVEARMVERSFWLVVELVMGLVVGRVVAV